MNQNYNQIQQNNQISQEELAKTQVLNLNDVQEIAKFERTTSKRPAILFAFAGILAITLGFAYPNIMAALDADPNENIKKRTETNENLNDDGTTQKMTSCTLNSPENPDGTSGSAVYNLVFDENDQLQSYTMILQFTPLHDNVAGQNAVQSYYGSYKSLENTPIEGYTILTTYENASMKTIAAVDLTKFDPNTLTQEYKNNYFAQVPFSYGETKQSVTTKLGSQTYICK